MVSALSVQDAGGKVKWIHVRKTNLILEEGKELNTVQCETCISIQDHVYKVQECIHS